MIEDFDFDKPVDLKKFSRKELDAIIFTKKYWLCGVNECTSYTAVRDYGTEDGLFYWVSNDRWIDPFKVAMICGKCSRKYRGWDWWTDKNGRHAGSLPKGVITRCMLPVLPGDEFRAMKLSKQTKDEDMGQLFRFVTVTRHHLSEDTLANSHFRHAETKKPIRPTSFGEEFISVPFPPPFRAYHAYRYEEVEILVEA